MKDELVSCILATRNRRRYLAQALRCYLRQSYPDKELIVVDDSDSSNERLFRGYERVRYLYLPKFTRLGTKLNIGIEASRGSILQKLDDDDYYHPEFVATNVASLAGTERGSALSIRCCFLALLKGDPKVRFSGHGWTAGGSLCCHREMWERHPFRNIRRRVDTYFRLDHDPLLIPVCRPHEYLVVRHGANTWNQIADGDADDYFRTHCEPWSGGIEQIMPERDRRSYWALMRKDRALASLATC